MFLIWVFFSYLILELYNVKFKINFQNIVFSIIKYNECHIKYLIDKTISQKFILISIITKLQNQLKTQLAQVIKFDVRLGSKRILSPNTLKVMFYIIVILIFKIHVPGCAFDLISTKPMSAPLSTWIRIHVLASAESINHSGHLRFIYPNLLLYNFSFFFFGQFFIFCIPI